MSVIMKFFKKLWYGRQFEMEGFEIVSRTPKGFSIYKDEKNHFPFFLRYLYNDNSYEIFLPDSFRKYEVLNEDKELIKKRIKDFYEFSEERKPWIIFNEEM